MATDSPVDELAGDVFDVEALLAYQTGAIVSRTLIDKESGTVTVFAFDEDERLSEHTAPHDALLEVLDGRAAVTVAGEEYELDAGESVVLPADEPHAVDAVDRFKMLLSMIH